MPHPHRNDLCPCGSGKKYKRCCLQLKHEFDSPSISTENMINNQLNQLSNKASSRLAALPNGYNVEQQDHQANFELVFSGYCYLWNISKCANTFQNEILQTINYGKYEGVFRQSITDLKRDLGYIHKMITGFSTIGFENEQFITEVEMAEFNKDEVYALKAIIIQELTALINLLVSFPLSDEEKKWYDTKVKNSVHHACAQSC